MIASVMPTYSRAPLTFVKGEGSWLIEADGRRFLDLGADISEQAGPIAINWGASGILTVAVS